MGAIPGLIRTKTWGRNLSPHVLPHVTFWQPLSELRLPMDMLTIYFYKPTQRNHKGP
jgi:hypothetical protein